MTTSVVTFPTMPTIRFPLLAPGTCTVRFNDASSGLLASGDRVYPNKISLSWKRKPEKTFAIVTPYIDEPIYGAEFDCSGTIGFPRASAAAEWNRLIANTETKVDIAFTGSTIGGGITYKWFFEYPSVVPKPEGLWKPSKSNLLSYDVGFMVKEGLSNPSGMAFTRPRFTLTDNVNAYHYNNGA